MWFLLIKHISDNFTSPKVLEIGVFKGQAISLWSLISLKINANLSIQGISPLTGNSKPKIKILEKIKLLFDKKFHEEVTNGNFYSDEDYLQIIKSLFDSFDLAFADVEIIKGFSTENHVLEKVSTQKYNLIYIDGDHTFSGVTQDINNYHKLIEPNGFLVMDDASFYLPGTTFWKGHKSVSRACNIIPSLGFINVMNVGHNRIYQKIS